MSADLVDRLSTIVSRVAENTKFAREPERVRRRLAELIKFAEEHLKIEVELPKFSKAKVTLDQADTTIEKLLIQLQCVLDIPVDELAALYRLNQKNWSILRPLPITIWIVDKHLRDLQSTLGKVRSDLDEFKDHRNRRHEIHDVVNTCIMFFDEYLGLDKITKSATLLSEFVDELFIEFDFDPLPSPKIVRACVEEYLRIADLLERKIVRPDSE